jgi:hypothetical protein
VARKQKRDRKAKPIAKDEDFVQHIASAAEDAVAVCEYLHGDGMDYSEASLAIIDQTLGEAATWDNELTQEQLENFAQDFGCYILEVGRREFGGRYCWFERADAPVLVVGEPDCRIALLTLDQVRGRLSGDSSCNIPFFYAGFAERARRAEPGTDVLYV